MNRKLLILCIVTLAAAVTVATFHRIPQNPAYHHFADHTTILGIPNFLNVVSNLPFLFAGILGLSQLKKSGSPGMISFVYAILFFGIFLTGLGSAYYHYAPDNNSLVWDRIPMTIVFMAFFSATIATSINYKLGALLLFPLLLTGIGSVLWWHETETRGVGDLRLYGFVQFYPMIAIPLIILLFHSAGNNRQLRFLFWVFTWYIIAKIFEYFDQGIYTATHFISGHSLKHLAAAVATWYMVKIGIATVGTGPTPERVKTPI